MGDNLALDDRNGVRTPMQWDNSKNAGFSRAEQPYVSVINSPPFDPANVNVATQQGMPDSLWQAMHRMIMARKEHPALRHISLDWLECDAPAVAAYTRVFENDCLVIFNNLSGESQKMRVKIQGDSFTDVLSGRVFAVQGEHLEITLHPYEYLWLEG
jgi:maltose alpha-D-glucosyltransferase / alpha-amylase